MTSSGSKASSMPSPSKSSTWLSRSMRKAFSRDALCSSDTRTRMRKEMAWLCSSRAGPWRRVALKSGGEKESWWLLPVWEPAWWEEELKSGKEPGWLAFWSWAGERGRRAWPRPRSRRKPGCAGRRRRCGKDGCLPSPGRERGEDERGVGVGVGGEEASDGRSGGPVFHNARAIEIEKFHLIGYA